MAFHLLRGTIEAEHHERLHGFLMMDPGGFQQRHLQDKIPARPVNDSSGHQVVL